MLFAHDIDASLLSTFTKSNRMNVFQHEIECNDDDDDDNDESKGNRRNETKKKLKLHGRNKQHHHSSIRQSYINFVKSYNCLKQSACDFTIGNYYSCSKSNLEKTISDQSMFNSAHLHPSAFNTIFIPFLALN